MILQSIQLRDMPVPPSANNLFATSWQTRRRFKSREYLMYERMLLHWRDINPQAVTNAREFVSKIDQGEAFKIECSFYLERSKVLTKKNTIKKRDSSNYLKALHDALAQLLNVDDAMFLDGSYETKVLNIDRVGWCDVTISIIQIENF